MVAVCAGIVLIVNKISFFEVLLNFYYCRLSIIQVAVAFQCKEEINSTIVDG